VNVKQTLVVALAAAPLALTLMHAPWKSVDQTEYGTSTFVTKSAIWSPPFQNPQLDVQTLSKQWIAIGVVAGGMFAVFRDRRYRY
jgi:hypothetical protein